MIAARKPQRKRDLRFLPLLLAKIMIGDGVLWCIGKDKLFADFFTIDKIVYNVQHIMRSQYPPLDDARRSFLESHKKVILVAFGQHTVAFGQDIHMILQNLLKLMEQGHIDGIMWARLSQEQLPVTIIQTSSRTYSSQDIVNHPDIHLMAWAPQYAILQHPSTCFFISHGGVGSLHEALYSGVRLFVYTFFGDQRANTKGIELIGVGKQIETDFLKYDTADYQEVYTKFYAVAVDPDNKIKDAIKRYSAANQVMALNAIVRVLMSWKKVFLQVIKRENCIIDLM